MARLSTVPAVFTCGAAVRARSRGSRWSRCGALRSRIPGGSRRSRGPRRGGRGSEGPRDELGRDAPRADGGVCGPRVRRVGDVADRVDALVGEAPERLGVDLDDRDRPAPAFARNRGARLGGTRLRRSKRSRPTSRVHGAAGRVHRQYAGEGLVGEDVAMRRHGLEEPGRERERRRAGARVDRGSRAREAGGPSGAVPRGGRTRRAPAGTCRALQACRSRRARPRNARDASAELEQRRVHVVGAQVDLAGASGSPGISSVARRSPVVIRSQSYATRPWTVTTSRRSRSSAVTVAWTTSSPWRPSDGVGPRRRRRTGSGRTRTGARRARRRRAAPARSGRSRRRGPGAERPDRR